MICTFDNGAKCIALTCKKCEGCTFFKTDEQLILGRKSAAVRVDRLPDDVRVHIRAKYPRGDV